MTAFLTLLVVGDVLKLAPLAEEELDDLNPPVLLDGVELDLPEKKSTRLSHISPAMSETLLVRLTITFSAFPEDSPEFSTAPMIWPRPSIKPDIPYREDIASRPMED